jgi:hypothetical protein
LKVVRDIAERCVEYGRIVWACIIEDVVFDFLGATLERATGLLLLLTGLSPAVSIATVSPAAATLVVVVIVVVAPGPLGSRDDGLNIALVSHCYFDT